MHAQWVVRDALSPKHRSCDPSTQDSIAKQDRNERWGDAPQDTYTVCILSEGEQFISVVVLADISVRSPRKLLIFVTNIIFIESSIPQIF